MKWEIVLYETLGGQQVVRKFILGLDAISQAKVLRQIELLEKYGVNLSVPHSKPLGGGLQELRVRGKREVRIFYMYTVKRRIFLLHGFVKKTQRTPQRELEIARKRQNELNQV